MTSTSTPTTIPHDRAEITAEVFDNWFDPIEAAVRDRVREFIQATIEDELEATLVRPRYGRQAKDDAEQRPGPAVGHRHGRRARSLLGSFGRVEF